MDSQAFNIITVLANHLFIYLIVPEDQYASTSVMDIMDHKQDPFVYITIECYTPKEFYGVIINIGALKKSTAGYGQYFAYKAINDNTDIDTMQTRAVNI